MRHSRRQFAPAQTRRRQPCYPHAAKGAANGEWTMFCPECGEVAGSGPLDARRARHARDRHGLAKTAGLWARAKIAALVGARRIARRED
ncbi:MAG: hypothetical protein M0R03_01960 [Novosphingobium sp.]|nr:hypothetical protein [Novosphingobium sp.]